MMDVILNCKCVAKCQINSSYCEFLVTILNTYSMEIGQQVALISAAVTKRGTAIRDITTQTTRGPVRRMIGPRTPQIPIKVSNRPPTKMAPWI